jgi:hypothetical protein
MKRVHSARPAALVFGALWLLACSDGGGGGKKADDGGVTPSTACGDDAPCADGKSCVSGRCIDATEVPVTVRCWSATRPARRPWAHASEGP